MGVSWWITAPLAAVTITSGVATRLRVLRMLVRVWPLERTLTFGLTSTGLLAAQRSPVAASAESGPSGSVSSTCLQARLEQRGMYC